MSDAQALVPVDFTQLPATQMGSDDAFDDLAKGGDFLARLQLCSKDKYVIGDMIGPGHWGIPESAEEIVDLGKSIDVVPFARRPKAVDLNDKDAIITVYDMESDEFKRIAAKSMQQNSKCMYGPSFLVYERSSCRFLEWFCGSKSTRSEAKKIYPYLALTAEDIEKRGLNGVEPHGALPFTMNVKLVVARFPPYQKVIPSVTQRQVQIDPRALGVDLVHLGQLPGRETMVAAALDEVAVDAVVGVEFTAIRVKVDTRDDPCAEPA